MKIENKKEAIVIYKGSNGKVELRADIKKDTIWATQSQISELFNVKSQAITKHIKNIYSEKELSKSSTCSKMEQVKIEGGRVIKRILEFYNLDVIIAVGYRINSKKATQFRIWATGILREHLVKGYALNNYKLSESEEAIEGLHEAITLIESKKYPGKLKGHVTIKLRKDFKPLD